MKQVIYKLLCLVFTYTFFVSVRKTEREPFGEMCFWSGDHFAKSVYKTEIDLKRTEDMFHSSQRRWLSMGSNPDQKSNYRPFRLIGSMRGIRSVRWFPIPVAFGLAFISYKRYKSVRQRDETSSSANAVSIVTDLEVSLLNLLPLRFLSRLWGFVNSIYLPIWLRTSVIGGYSRFFGCAVHEAVEEDFRSYKNLSQFFRRDLKPGLRPVASGDVIVSPADGTIVHFGKVEDELIEQVKGVTYSLPAFLGPQTWINTVEGTKYRENLFLSAAQSGEKSLYHCVIYLAPGDYHKFHSPVEWQVKFRRHFPGKLFSVRPSFASWFPRLFTVNERVAYIGEWMHGFFSLVAVGATNVGSIKVYSDECLKTNNLFHRKKGYFDRNFVDVVKYRKGDSFGEFNLGSTIVLLFEAPNDFTFNVRSGDKVKYGEMISSSSDNRQLKS